MRPVLAALLVLLAGRPARAEENPHLARAHAELNELRYDKAKDALADALKWGKSSPSEVAEIYRLTGEVSAALGDAKKAEDAFAHLLAIDPGVRLSSGVSPKISGPFNVALKASQGRDPVKLHHETHTGEAPTITLVVDSDPLNMVKGARAQIEGGPSGPDSREARGKGRIDLDLPPAGRLTVILAALDEHGNRLAELGREDPIVIEGGPVPEATPPPPEEDAGGGTTRPFYARWYLWGGLAVGFAAVGTYFGMGMRSDVDKANDLSAQTRMPGGEFTVDFADAKEYADRAERKALIANLNFGAAGVCAIVGGIFLYLELSSTPSEERTAVVPVPLDDGAGLVFSGQF